MIHRRYERRIGIETGPDRREQGPRFEDLDLKNSAATVGCVVLRRLRSIRGREPWKGIPLAGRIMRRDRPAPVWWRSRWGTEPGRFAAGDDAKHATSGFRPPNDGEIARYSFPGPEEST